MLRPFFALGVLAFLKGGVRKVYSDETHVLISTALAVEIGG